MANINSQFMPDGLLYENKNSHTQNKDNVSHSHNRSHADKAERSEKTLQPTNVESQLVDLTSSQTLSINIAIRSLSSELSSGSLKAETQPRVSDEKNDRLSGALLSEGEKRLSRAESKGATDDELHEIINQSLTKINSGFSEAKSEISSVGITDTASLTKIEQSQQTINSELEQLAQKITEKNPTEEIKPSNNSENSHEKSALVDVAGNNFNALQVTNENYASQTKTSDLTIKTKDGDLVTIQFFDKQTQSNSEQFSYQGSNQSQSSVYQQSQTASQNSFFSFSIEGDIDDEEYAAISSLMNDIQSLQEEFFNGDVMKAYEQALTMGFDDSELAGFSLDLTKSTTHVASQAYNAVATLDEPKHIEGTKTHTPKEEFTKLLGFIDQIQQLQESAESILTESREQALNIISKTVEIGSITNSVSLTQFSQFYEKFSLNKLTESHD